MSSLNETASLPVYCQNVDYGYFVVIQTFYTIVIVGLVILLLAFYRVWTGLPFSKKKVLKRVKSSAKSSKLVLKTGMTNFSTCVSNIVLSRGNSKGMAWELRGNYILIT
jgi:hypothetical protein